MLSKIAKLPLLVALSGAFSLNLTVEDPVSNVPFAKPSNVLPRDGKEVPVKNSSQ